MVLVLGKDAAGFVFRVIICCAGRLCVLVQSVEFKFTAAVKFGLNVKVIFHAN